MKSRSKNKPHGLNKKPENRQQSGLSHQIPPEILENLPESTKTAVIEASSSSFTGPLPPPTLYAHYDEVLPGSADRIMKLAEHEQFQRHKWESDDLHYRGKETVRGQWLGFLLAAGMIGGSIYCAMIGQPWIAAIMIGSSTLGIVTAFIKGRSTSNK